MSIHPKVTLLVAVLFAVLLSSANGRAEELKFTIDGTERVALVFPPSTPGAGKAPVVFAFHGHGGNAKEAAGMGFQNAWPEAIVVYMQGLPGIPSELDPNGEQPGWQRAAGEAGNRDLKFFDAVLAELHKKYAVDDGRIYATGFSNGGFFDYLLWAERGRVFAAFAPCAAMIWPSIHLSGPHPILIIAGKSDDTVPFAKQQEAIDEVMRVDDCAKEGKEIGPGVTYYPSRYKTPVVTFIHPGAHVWPGSATKAIVKFFKNHPGGG
jgi:polyhydroxybutyrate depolymerase